MTEQQRKLVDKTLEDLLKEFQFVSIKVQTKLDDSYVVMKDKTVTKD